MQNSHSLESPRLRIILLVSLLLAGAWIVAGCGILDEGEPERVRVRIDGAEGHPIQLVITDDFDVLLSEEGENRDVFLYSADTSSVTAPFDRSFDLGPNRRFYSTFSSDQVASELVSVKVWVEDDLRYDRQTVFQDEVLEFLYTLR